jgi:putative ABC transport system ATP-binding protein
VSDPVLVIRALSKRHALGDVAIDVLRGVDLTIDEGELVAVMGPSGVGKSTLLACAAGLDAPSSGSVKLLGRELAGLDEDARAVARRTGVGIVYQAFHLVANLTARENVSLPFLIDDARVDDAAIDAAMARVGMTARRDHLPAQLSGGEQQLVAIARALVRAPRLILADEPTGNLNLATGRKVMALLRDAVRERQAAMLLVTHDPDSAARADRVEFMIDGALVADAKLTGDRVTTEAVLGVMGKLGI